MGVTNNNHRSTTTSVSPNTNTSSPAIAAAHRAQLHLRHVTPAMNARKGCTKASPLAPQQKSIYVKAFLVWSVCTLGGWLSIDTEYLPLWSHLVGFGFFLTITTRKTRWLGALVIAALVFSSLMYQLLPQNWVTTLTNSVGYGGIALALMLAFLCRRAANHSSIPSFDIDYSPLQLPEDLLQILSTISGHPAVVAATALAAEASAAIVTQKSDGIESLEPTVTKIDTINPINNTSSSSSSSTHIEHDTKKAVPHYPSSMMKGKQMDEETSPFLGDEYHTRLVEYPASRSDLCALICQMHRMQHHQMMMARNAAAEQLQQITKLSAQLDMEVERRLRAENALARATAVVAGNASSTSVTSTATSISTASTSSPSPSVSVITCECGRRYDRDGNKVRRKDRNANASGQASSVDTIATPAHWDKERALLTQQLQLAISSKQESEAQIVELQSQVNRLKLSLQSTIATAPANTNQSSSSSSSSPDDSTSSTPNNAGGERRSVRDWNQLRASLQRAEATIESYDTQLNELRRSATRRHAMAKAASARMALRMEALTIDNTNLRKQMAALAAAASSSGRQSSSTTIRSSKSRAHRASLSESTPLNIPSVPSSDSTPSSSSPPPSSTSNTTNGGSIDDSIDSSGADSPLSSSSPSTCPPSPSSLHSTTTSSPLTSSIVSGSSMQRSLLNLTQPLIIDDATATLVPSSLIDDEYVAVSVDDDSNLLATTSLLSTSSQSSSSATDIDSGAGMQLLCQQLVRFLDDPHEPHAPHTADIA